MVLQINNIFGALKCWSGTLGHSDRAMNDVPICKNAQVVQTCMQSHDVKTRKLSRPACKQVARGLPIKPISGCVRNCLFPAV